MNNEELVMNDLDQDYAKRLELIQQAKALSESEEPVDFKEVERLQKAFRRIPSQESLSEQELVDQFDGYLNKFYALKAQDEASAKANKEALILKAKELAKDTRNWKEMNALMDQWKEAGRCNRNDDETLWNEFNNVRQSFYDARKKAMEALKANFGNAKEAKTALVEKAKEIANGEDINAISQQMNDLMDQWKAAGRAEKEVDDALWAQFNEVRQSFYDRKRVYIEELKAAHAKASEAKTALIEKAKDYVKNSDYSKETVEVVKNLVNDWKAVGYAGKGSDDRLWKEFRATLDEYFAGLKEFNEYRKEQYKNRLEANIEKKAKFINDQRVSVERLEAKRKEMISESALHDLQDSIDQKKAFITQLEEELADMQARLK